MASSLCAALALGATLGTSQPAAPDFMLAGPEPVVVTVTAEPTMFSPLALAAGSISGFDDKAKPKRKDPKRTKDGGSAESPGDEGLGPERARILLRSLTFPGWGQATLGRKTSARVFALTEVGIWSAFVAFRVQEGQRVQSYLRTARLGAGIDLADQDDEFRRIVGAFASSEEYNLLVVTRDAANIYLSDPDNLDIEGYRAYIAENSLSGDMAWAWSDEATFQRYGGQRKFAQKAALRANAALGFAIANRLVSALHAARAAGHSSAGGPQGWRLEVSPVPDANGRLTAALTKTF